MLLQGDDKLRTEGQERAGQARSLCLSLAFPTCEVDRRVTAACAAKAEWQVQDASVRTPHNRTCGSGPQLGLEIPILCFCPPRRVRQGWLPTLSPAAGAGSARASLGGWEWQELRSWGLCSLDPPWREGGQPGWVRGDSLFSTRAKTTGSKGDWGPGFLV